MAKNKDSISIVVPVFNPDISSETIESLLLQDYSGLDYEIIIIYDGEQPSEFYQKWLEKKGIRFHKNEKNLGLAKSYNKGIELAKYNKVMIIHEDCVPESERLVKNMCLGLQDHLVVNAMVDFPASVTEEYSFWNKILLYRYSNLKCQALGKITGFRKEVFEKVGFDNETYRTAGEDMDFMKQCADRGIEIGVIKDTVIHKHRATNANFKAVVKKSWQLGEAHGAYKRKHGLFNWLGHFDLEIRVFLLFISLFTLWGLFPFFAIACWQTAQNYKNTGWEKGLYTYPILGTLIMLIATIAAIKSFITGKQTI